MPSYLPPSDDPYPPPPVTFTDLRDMLRHVRDQIDAERDDLDRRRDELATHPDRDYFLGRADALLDVAQNLTDLIGDCTHTQLTGPDTDQDCFMCGANMDELAMLGKRLLRALP